MNVSLASVLGVKPELLSALEKRHDKEGLVRAGEQELEKKITDMVGSAGSASEVRQALGEKIREHEAELYRIVGIDKTNFDFEKLAGAARTIATKDTGWFLKKEYAADILRKHPPTSTLAYLGYSNVEDMLQKEDVGEVFSALRFTESNEWMHQTFDIAYSSFTPEDFEERRIELRVLGEQWKEVAEKYVAKKHHNVSHLKEFGVIFLNPIAQTEDGKFIRDFALLLHYFHEVAFYSKLFRKMAGQSDFNKQFISLLRGDVPELDASREGEWLIVQRYLWKENPQDPRLFLPRVNPEAMHWGRAEADLASFGEKAEESGLEFWKDSAHVAALFPNSAAEELVSFDLEDNAMQQASLSDGRQEYFFYHQREALWNRLFSSLFGGDEKMEELIVENMDKGIIRP